MNKVEYEESLKQLRDWKNVMRTLEKDSREDERLKTEKRVRKEEQEKAKQNLKEEQEKNKQEKIESIKNMLLKTDFTTSQITDILNVSKELVEQVKNQND